MFRLFNRSRGAFAAPAPGDRFAAAPGVAFTREGGRTILLDPDAGEYFGLDEVGSRIWELLGDGATLAQAVDALEAEYEAPRDVLERDAAALVADLLRMKLLARR